MKIALDCRSVFPGMGGIGRASAALARHLPAALAPDDELYLLLGERLPEPESLRPSVEGKLRVEGVPTRAGMLDPIFEQLRLPALLREIGADLIHTTCFTVPIPADAVARVATVHDVVFRRHPELVDPELRDYLDHWTQASCRLADAIVTPSRFSQGEIAACYDRALEEIAVVPNGVDARFLSLERTSPQGAPFLLYVGALEAKKNVPALLSAFRRLVAENPSLPHLLVLAGGSGGQRLDVEAALDLAGPARSRVRVLGHVTDEELLRLYSQAAAFVYLSRYEGFGLPPLEAMAAGVPTLVSGCSSLPEVVGDGALTVDPADEVAIVTALRELLVDEGLRQELSQRGRARARESTWEKAATAQVAVYRSAFELSRRRIGGAKSLAHPGRRGFRILSGGVA